MPAAICAVVGISTIPAAVGLAFVGAVPVEISCRVPVDRLAL